MWIQDAVDLTPSELKELRRLVVASLRRQPGIETVPSTFAGNFIGVSVVAEKVPDHPGGPIYIASSAIAVFSKKTGASELVTHDVAAEPDLVHLALAIRYFFASARFLASLGALN